MADKGIRITISDAPVLAALDRLEAATNNRAEAEDAIGAYLVTSTQRRFEREVGPDGQPWKRLSPRTANRRIGNRRRGFENILRVSRRLEQSIVYAVDDHEIAWGSNVVYAAIQHLGGEIEQPERQQTIYQNYDARTDTFDPKFRTKRRSNFARDVSVSAHTITIPARPYIGLDAADRKEILAIVEDHYRTEGGLQ
ncbi:phage virion morphogenesis protein [Neorhizobium petrolearium]|uniref:phage virion morphogenesis protein n=1 Tax=Neorhizobium petrolearium TaxID=515361 RepID=UPI003F816660